MTENATFRDQIIERFWANAQVTREDIFGLADPVPRVELENAYDMWPGYAGSNYRPGGLVLLGLSPAGGTVAYGGGDRARRDRQFYFLIRAFKNSDARTRLRAFQDLMDFCKMAIPQWGMFKIVDLVLKAAKSNLDEIAIINLMPYRIAENRPPSRYAVAAAWRLCTEPALSVLKPRRLAALGLAAGKALAGRDIGGVSLFVLRRTNGDNYVHDEAIREARRLAESIAHDN